MLPRTLVGVAVVFASALALSGSALGQSRWQVSCTNVTGTIAGVAIPIFSGGAIVGFHEPALTITGDLGGGGSADLVVDKVTPGGALHLSGAHHFTDTIVGSFDTSDTIIATPSGVVHDTLTVISGDAWGRLTTHGTIVAMTGALALAYHGRVCR